MDSPIVKYNASYTATIIIARSSKKDGRSIYLASRRTTRKSGRVVGMFGAQTILQESMR